MRTCRLDVSLIAKILVVWAVAVGVAWAQQYGGAPASGTKGVPRVADGGKGGDKGEMVRIQKLTGLGRQARVSTPEYRTTVPRGIRSAQEWTQIAVQFATAPEWVDELTFQFYAFAMTTKEGKNQYSLFKNSIRCVDIERGRDHTVTMFLGPTVIKRYGELVAVAVEISAGGKVIAEESEIAAKQIPAEWWKKPEVVGNENVKTRDGYLLDRSRSPFAFINMDDYPFVK